MSKRKLKEYYKEVFFIQPNDFSLPFFDKAFHKIVPYLKRYPFIFLLPLAFLLSLFFIFLFGPLVLKLVSFLQHGI